MKIAKHQFSSSILLPSTINFKLINSRLSRSINTRLLTNLTKMLANLPVEIILLICEYPEFKDLGQLAWTSKRMMQIIKKHLPKALVLDRKTLFYLPYQNDYIAEGRIYLFDSHTNSVKKIAKFTNYLPSYEVAVTKDKIFALNSLEKWFEKFDLNTRKITREPNPPKWREYASVAYFKDKLYYLGGNDPKTGEYTNRVDVLIDKKWQTGPVIPFQIGYIQTITCDEILYAIDGENSRKIYRLSDDELKWVEIGEIPERRDSFGVASLNGRIYITGGGGNGVDVLKSCLCFDPSAPVDNRISRIADMNYKRENHSLIVANEKLYAIGGFQKLYANLCNSIEKYVPQANEWREVGLLRNLPATSESAGRKTRTNRTNENSCLLS